MSGALRTGRAVFFAYALAALAATLMALPLAAQQRPATPPQPNFEQIDRNKDGFIDKSEAAAVQGLSANFEKADTNKDGKLDKVEFAKALARPDINK